MPDIRRRMVLGALVVALPALGLYWRTLLPDVGFWDTAEFQAIGPVLGIAHPTGYPTYTLLAWLASVLLQPFGDEALRANLMSALAVAAACGLVALTVTVLTRRAVIGIVAGIALALASEPWSIALAADPHALHLGLVALLLFTLVVWGERTAHGRPADRWLVGAAAIYAVALGNHALTLLLAPGIALYVLFVEPKVFRRWRLVATCVLTFVGLTVAIYAYLPLRSAMNPPLDYGNPQTLQGFLYVVLGTQFQGDFGAWPGLAVALQRVVAETFAELGPFAPLALVGAIVGAYRRPGLVLLLITWFSFTWFFALGYSNADIDRYYLVPIMCAAVLGSLAVGEAWRVLSRAASRGSRVAVSRDMVPTIALSVTTLLLALPALIAVPSQLPLLDQSADHYARDWLDTAMAELPPNAMVISWWSYSTTLWYGQYVEHRRPDVTVVDDSTIEQQDLGSPQAVIDANLGRRPVFLIRTPYDLGAYEQRYVLTPLPNLATGAIYEVQARAGNVPVGDIGAAGVASGPHL
jgi:Protein O-mannosyl-transferase TMEM260-like